MIDAGFTCGGHVLGFVAIGLWLRLACTAPATQARILAWILARYEDELRLGTPYAAPARSARAAVTSQVAYGVALAAIVCRSIGLAIPD